MDTEFETKCNFFCSLTRQHDPALSFDEIWREIHTAKFSTDSFIRMFNTVLAFCHRRRLFITEEGYMGLGPEALEVGDRVAILLGGETPFVLRTAFQDYEYHGASSQYQLVGECYVRDMMSGEIIEVWKSGQLVSEDIVLV
ncbi:hypothetical protein BU16DRAFT_566051 [Lophium mytilinum]|uniref:Heterokaryon incompatibility domain-containing protein n=1 Tax=Lophium mytilinum TaxID=390894 RepID=A0A6A6QFG4_9PEZI|nr:hypothetical protein BU16DRAFT_566051 [Lophium mytilinum]